MDNEKFDTEQSEELAPRFTRQVEWERVDEQGEEECALFEFDDAARWVLHGSLDFPLSDVKALWMRYIIACDADWHLIRIVLATANNPFDLVDFPEVSPLLFLSATDDNTWYAGVWHGIEQERPDLRGCTDLDLSCTPSTNTLAIRRLNLGVGESAEITAAWVRFPELSAQQLAVQPLRQRYTRLAPDRYRYESLDGTFTAELTVDDQGLVVDYPGGWRRKEPGPYDEFNSHSNGLTAKETPD